MSVAPGPTLDQLMAQTAASIATAAPTIHGRGVMACRA